MGFLLLTIGLMILIVVPLWLRFDPGGQALMERLQEVRKFREIDKKGPRVQIGPNLWRIGPPDGDFILEGPLEDWEVAMLSEDPRMKRKLEKLRKRGILSGR